MRAAQLRWTWTAGRCLSMCPATGMLTCPPLPFTNISSSALLLMHSRLSLQSADAPPMAAAIPAAFKSGDIKLAACGGIWRATAPPRG